MRKLITIMLTVFAFASFNSHAANLLGKTVFITGGTSPIGLSTARHLHKKGAKVIISSRNQDKLNSTIESLRSEGFENIFGISGDLVSKNSAYDLFQKAKEISGTLDILVNNAGLWETVNFIDIEEDTLIMNLQVLVGTIFITQAIVKYWREENIKGAVVNIGSASVGQPLINAPCIPHVMQKTGIHEMSTAIATELAPFGIRSNTISLGTVGDEEYEKSLPPEIMSLYPLNRIGRYDEVAKTVEFLADNELSGWITGATFNMDGGQSASR